MKATQTTGAATQGPGPGPGSGGAPAGEAAFPGAQGREGGGHNNNGLVITLITHAHTGAQNAHRRRCRSRLMITRRTDNSTHSNRVHTVGPVTRCDERAAFHNLTGNKAEQQTDLCADRLQRVQAAT